MKSKQLLNIIGDVDEKYIDEARPNNKSIITKKTNRMKLGAIAACLAVFILSAVTIPFIMQNNSVTPIQQMTPSASPNGMRKIMNYNNYRYAFLDDGSTYNLSQNQLTAPLGTIEYDIMEDPEANALNNFAATFAIGGKIYQLSTYNPEFRLAVEFDGKYYICERVDRVDETTTAIDVAEYFKLAEFPSKIEKIVINDHAERSELKSISGKKVSSFIEILSKVTPATLTSEDYLRIANAQTSGESYLLSFQLKDSTQYKMYIIPTLSLAMIGDNNYTLPSDFDTKFGSLFEGLVQQPLPMY